MVKRGKASNTPLQSGTSSVSLRLALLVFLTIAAATYGQLGFIQTLAKEGVKYNILASVVESSAEIRPSEIDSIVQMVLSLAHSSNSRETGHLYQVRSGRCSKVRWQRAAGALLNPESTLSPGVLLNAWASVNDFSRPTYPDSSADFPALLVEALKAPPSKKGKELRLDRKVALVTGASSGYVKLHPHLGHDLT